MVKCRRLDLLFRADAFDTGMDAHKPELFNEGSCRVCDNVLELSTAPSRFAIVPLLLRAVMPTSTPRLGPSWRSDVLELQEFLGFESLGVALPIIREAYSAGEHMYSNQPVNRQHNRRRRRVPLRHPQE